MYLLHGLKEKKISTHLFFTDAHSNPKFNNNRALLLGKLINDVKPDIVINGGDGADMPSLSSYDKGTKGFVGRTYQKDIDHYVEFEDKLWWEVRRSKKKLPRRVILEGNHEERIKRAVNLSPELDGAFSPKDLQRENYYQEVIEYDGNTPGIINIDGIDYGHYFVSGVMGRPIGGEHIGYSLITKRFVSSSCGHIHTLDFTCRTVGSGVRKIYGLSGGCFIDYPSDWAGEASKLWWSGVVIKRNVEDGTYDPEFISLERLKKIYG